MTVSPEWYLLQTKARQESLARDNLERQRYRSWLPRLRVRRPRSERIEPLFPGYLFVQLSPDVDDFGPIRSTVGVLRLVKFSAAYARVPNAWVNDLRSRANADDVCDMPHKPIAPGDNVEIVDGALAGYEAVVAELRGRDRVALLLKVAGRHVALVAPRSYLQPSD